MSLLRRVILAVSMLFSLACVLLLRDLSLRDTVPLPVVEDALVTRFGPLAARMLFPNVLPVALLVLLAAALTALAVAWRSDGLPSLANDVRLRGPAHAFLAGDRISGACLGAFAVLETALVVTLVRDAIPPAWLWGAALAALVALAAASDRRAPRRRPAMPAPGAVEAWGVLLVAGACAALAGHGLNGWEWAGSEDSYGFYGVARELFQGARVRPFLSPDGVFAMYAVPSSWLQAILYPLFGPTGEALRAANLLLVAGLVVLGHVFARPFAGRAGALATGGLLGSSVLVQTYAKFGYNNLQGVFFAMLALTLASRAAAGGRWVPLVLSGIAAGAGLFSYALAAVAGAAVLVWIAASSVPTRVSVRTALRAAAVFALAAAAAGAPCLLSRHYVRVHLPKLSLFSPELRDGGPAATPLSTRFVHGLAQPVYNIEPGHGAAGPRLDPISAFLLLAGFASLAAGADHAGASRALLALALVFPAAIALLQPYALPTSPWVLLATPSWAILGGVGAAALARAFLPWRAARGAAVPLLVAGAVAWSTWQVHVSSLEIAPLSPLAFTVAAARAARASRGPAVLVVPVPANSGAAAPIVEAVTDADVPDLGVETPAFDDPALPERLARLAARPTLLALYESGEPFPARSRLRDAVRERWPGAREFLYLTRPGSSEDPCLRVFVNVPARPAGAQLPLRNLARE